jgi:hypothetical protein
MEQNFYKTTSRWKMNGKKLISKDIKFEMFARMPTLVCFSKDCVQWSTHVKNLSWSFIGIAASPFL